MVNCTDGKQQGSEQSPSIKGWHVGSASKITLESFVTLSSQESEFSHDTPIVKQVSSHSCTGISKSLQSSA